MKLIRLLDQLEKTAKLVASYWQVLKKLFAAGADIKEMADLAFPDIYFDDFFHLADRIAQRRKPLNCSGEWLCIGWWLRISTDV